MREGAALRGRGEFLHPADRFVDRRRSLQGGIVRDADGEAQRVQRFADFGKFGLAVRPVDAGLGDMGCFLASVADGGFRLDQGHRRRECVDLRLQRLAAALGLTQGLLAALQRIEGEMAIGGEVPAQRRDVREADEMCGEAIEFADFRRDAGEPREAQPLLGQFVEPRAPRRDDVLRSLEPLARLVVVLARHEAVLDRLFGLLEGAEGDVEQPVLALSRLEQRGGLRAQAVDGRDQRSESAAGFKDQAADVASGGEHCSPPSRSIWWLSPKREANLPRSVPPRICGEPPRRPAGLDRSVRVLTLPLRRFRPRRVPSARTIVAFMADLVGAESLAARAAIAARRRENR